MAMQERVMRRGAAVKHLRRMQGRKQRSQTMTSPSMMASLQAVEGLLLAQGCAPAMAERYVVQARPCSPQSAITAPCFASAHTYCGRSPAASIADALVVCELGSQPSKIIAK